MSNRFTQHLPTLTPYARRLIIAWEEKKAGQEVKVTLDRPGIILYTTNSRGVYTNLTERETFYQQHCYYDDND